MSRPLKNPPSHGWMNEGKRMQIITLVINSHRLFASTCVNQRAYFVPLQRSQIDFHNFPAQIYFLPYETSAIHS